jgi:hypothetical protein
MILLERDDLGKADAAGNCHLIAKRGLEALVLLVLRSSVAKD